MFLAQESITTSRYIQSRGMFQIFPNTYRTSRVPRAVDDSAALFFAPRARKAAQQQGKVFEELSGFGAKEIHEPQGTSCGTSSLPGKVKPITRRSSDEARSLKVERRRCESLY